MEQESITVLRPDGKELRIGPDMLANILRTVAEQRESGVGSESLSFRANLFLELRGPDGRVKDKRAYHNLICTAGKNNILSAGGGKKYVNDYSYIAIGTGTTAAAIGDTALQTETARSPTQTPTNPTSSTWQVTYTFPAGTGTGAVTESGLDYQVSPSAAILAHQVFSAVNKGALDTLAVTWQIT